MFTIKGKYTEALVTTDNIEEEAISQITALVNHPAAEGSKIVIMPDVHSGKGTMVYGDKIYGLAQPIKTFEIDANALIEAINYYAYEEKEEVK